MQVDFEKNAVRPGDEGYVYDKRVEAPQGELEANEWDDELEDFETDDEDDKLLAELLASPAELEIFSDPTGEAGRAFGTIPEKSCLSVRPCHITHPTTIPEKSCPSVRVT